MVGSFGIQPGVRVLAIAVAMIIAMVFSQAQAQQFQFAAIGDTGYSKKSEDEFSRMIAAMNKEKLAFVVHVGDFVADPRPYQRNPAAISMPCTDESYQKVLAQFHEFSHPFIMTPGDNDWTDCHLLKLDPLERLAKVREIFFPDGGTLGKRTIVVDSQAKDPKHAKFRENLMWSVNNVMFMTMHFVGSNNNKGRTPEMDAEAAERTAQYCLVEEDVRRCKVKKQSGTGAHHTGKSWLRDPLDAITQGSIFPAVPGRNATQRVAAERVR